MAKFVMPKNEREFRDEIYDEKSMIMAGGTDLLVKMRIGKINPSKIVSTLRVPTFHALGFDGKELIIGANVTYSELLDFEPVKKAFPILYDAIYSIGSPQIRNRATLVGNLINASPAGDGLLALYLLDAKVEVSNGKRYSVGEFVRGPGQTILDHKEYVKSIIIEKEEWTHRYFEKVGQRNSMTISIASIGSLFKIEDGIVKEMRIAFGSVGPTVLRMHEIEEFTRDKKLDEDLIREISMMAYSGVKPIDDVRGSAEYRRRLCRNLIYRFNYILERS
ncbi:FAD binding domain-containing protein [Athalassotoga saccharophila]|uniref:FAD binding domain-containing protein n=1 Tax=Athalassotoga saccharophila TaxID=1441386 RepID=UPI00137A6AC2|nr:xanthine dehydrogenase family protein subunit M [Athalassotoga saccharophila]BBJ28874.1 nicotinate dehydrogenase FAD-subunit [Athalassotoga saccharophila]